MKPDRLNDLFSAGDWVPNCRCPRCGDSAPKTRNTMPVDEGTHTRTRYHVCRVKSCLDPETKRRTSFKTIELLRPSHCTA